MTGGKVTRIYAHQKQSQVWTSNGGMEPQAGRGGVVTRAAALNEGREEARDSRELVFVFIHRSATSILSASGPHL